ncbi:leucine--tRNA ligase [Haploplasma modicum]|uniref:leucine--tRNA ligase n=1 Tax=Haploplasma modicum TaxID=2150 RepID=UPI00047E6059|nr:leucine--tRNA ligase [Haploplasma modicum]
MNYNFKDIEIKWQNYWFENKMFKASNDPNKPKKYILDMFPYPSAQGLHVGHISGYTATDILSRYYRMKGFNVLHPFGWDAFGLPAEQFALKTGKDPEGFTKENISNFKKQIIRSGKGIDWDREISTAEPYYFKWTQWIFKKLYEHDLAEIKDVEVNWCKDLGTVLANDEIINVDGKMVSERGNYPVVKKAMRQWVLKITKYADRLLDDLELINWTHSLKEMQKNWIGKSQGAIIDFKVFESNHKIQVFTTRPDTIYGVTYVVLAPEHELVSSITTDSEKESVLNYIEETKHKSDLERQTNKEKTGIFSGSYAINPLNNKKVPIWIADYVLPEYGTGAVMAVPAHDERDFEFAQNFGLDMIEVIKNDSDDSYTGDGIHYNSGIIDGLNNEQATKKIIDYLTQTKTGYGHATYRLRDWVFSRQRYWGEPFPVVYDSDDNIIILDEEDLPLLLPKMKNIAPSGTGESPLANAHSWLNVEYKGKNVRRETNTMPQLAGSSWYYIGFILKEILGMIPLNSEEAKEELKKWLPVDIYLGGTEHAVGHLLYSRFWHKFLYDLGIVETKEPFLKLINQGMVLGPDNQKMSKSRGNVINPDDIIDEFGADTLRVYEMFMGPLTAEKSWSNESVSGIKRFLDRVFRMYQFEIVDEVEELNNVYHQTIKKVTEDIENLNFNTAISQLMIFVNDAYKVKKISHEQARGFIKLLNPFAPHITEEINKVVLNVKEDLIYSTWPSYDEKYLEVSEIELVIQVNGKLRARIMTKPNLTNEEYEKMALSDQNVIKHLENLTIRRVLVVPNKLVNIVAN